MPKLWNTTLEAHRRDVRAAILESAAALVAEQGLRSVTMAQIAADAGIGRATLYKYFSSVDAILRAWHEGQIATHLEHLAQARDRAENAGDRLRAVLEAYGLIMRETRTSHDAELAAFLHQDDQVAHGQQRLHTMLRDLLTEADNVDLRKDVPPDELASYCLHALTGAAALASEAAVRRLVEVTLAGLRPAR
jgi:AcrR family transcriptional regulator